MSKVKEQLAATLLNHVHVIDQSLALGRRSRRPTSKRYSQVAELDFSNPAMVSEVMKSFIAFNSKHFIENLRFAVDKQIEKSDGIGVTWAPKVLVRGLNGRIVAHNVEYNLATAIMSAFSFSRQSADMASALELSGNISPLDMMSTAMDFLIPAFKNSPFCNLEREQTDFNKIFAAKLLVIRSIVMVAGGLNEDQRKEIVNNRANIVVIVQANEQGLMPANFSLEETDSARAQRLARERLEEVRRRRTMAINTLTMADDSITYDVSPLIAPDEHQQISVNTNTLLGW